MNTRPVPNPPVSMPLPALTGALPGLTKANAGAATRRAGILPRAMRVQRCPSCADTASLVSPPSRACTRPPVPMTSANRISPGLGAS